MKKITVNSDGIARLITTFTVLELCSFRIWPKSGYRAVSGVFQNIDPPPPHSTQRVCPPPAPKAGGTQYTLAGRWGGGWSIFWKTPDIRLASYSIIPLRTFHLQHLWELRMLLGQLYFCCLPVEPRNGGQALQLHFSSLQQKEPRNQCYSTGI